MVKLNKIYTRTGDDGTTGLGTGDRVPKTDQRVVAYGTVDEANAAIGSAVSFCGDALGEPEVREALLSVQQDLFDVGADLCVPVEEGEGQGEQAPLRISPDQVVRIEGLIDRFNARLEPLTSFVLPGGSRLAASLHLSRTIVRRAERECVQLLASEPKKTSAVTVEYLNRLSDLLFVLARVANDDGRADVLWIPGANRTD